MKRPIAALAATLAITTSLVLTASPTFATNDNENEGQDKVTLCHATHSETNPFVEITVAVPSVPWTAHTNHQDNEDIIPPFGEFPGANWTEDNQLILENGCDLPQVTTTTTSTTSTTEVPTTTTSSVPPSTTSTTFVEPTTTVPVTTSTSSTLLPTTTTSSLPLPTTTTELPTPEAPVVTETALATTGSNTGPLLFLAAVLVLVGLLILNRRKS